MMYESSYHRHIYGFVCVAVLLFSFFILFATAHADNPSQGQYGSTSKFVPLADYSKSPQFNNVFNNGSANSLPQYINSVFTIALSVGAILAVLRIAYAGYMYMGSADMWGNKERAREMLGDAIVGILLLFAIYLILNQIDPNILNLNILQDVPSASATPNANQTNSSTCKSDAACGNSVPDDPSLPAFGGT